MDSGAKTDAVNSNFQCDKRDGTIVVGQDAGTRCRGIGPGNRRYVQLFNTMSL
jgi:hypothetical protein